MCEEKRRKKLEDNEIWELNPVEIETDKEGCLLDLLRWHKFHIFVVWDGTRFGKNSWLTWNRFYNSCYVAICMRLAAMHVTNPSDLKGETSIFIVDCFMSYRYIPVYYTYVWVVFKLRDFRSVAKDCLVSLDLLVFPISILYTVIINGKWKEISTYLKRDQPWAAM